MNNFSSYSGQTASASVKAGFVSHQCSLVIKMKFYPGTISRLWRVSMIKKVVTDLKKSVSYLARQMTENWFCNPLTCSYNKIRFRQDRIKDCLKTLPLQSSG